MTTAISEIAARVKICTLSTGRPRFTKLNKKETREMEIRHGTDAGRAIVTHCDHPSLEAYDKTCNEARTYHNGITRPTIDDSCRLLPVGKEFEHAAAMAKFRADAEKQAKEFLADYPQLKADAPAKLNGLHDPAAWPDESRIESKFRFLTSYRPCPTDGEWEEWLSVSVHAAQAELTEQLETAIRRVAERCASDGKLYQSVFSNLAELLALVPDLNLAADPKIAEIARQAAALAKQDQKTLVKDDSRRKMVAAQANALCSMFAPTVAPIPEPEPVEEEEAPQGWSTVPTDTEDEQDSSPPDYDALFA